MELSRQRERIAFQAGDTLLLKRGISCLLVSSQRAPSGLTTYRAGGQSSSGWVYDLAIMHQLTTTPFFITYLGFVVQTELDLPRSRYLRELIVCS